MTIRTERASNTSVETSPVSAVPIAGTESERELPTIELTHASLTEVEITHHHDIIQEDEGETAGSTTVVATMVEQIPISVRDIDVEGGYSTRALGNQNGRGEFVSGTFLKSNRHISLGFSLGKNGNEISSIATGSLVSASPLRVGDKIFSINNKQCSKMSRTAVCKFLGGLVGRVTVVAHNEGGSSSIVESMITKSTEREQVGVAVAVSGSRTVVTKILPGRPFVDSLLNVGDEVLAVNGVSCENLTAVAVADIMKESPKYVTVMAKTLSDTGVVVAQVSTRNTNTTPSSASPAQARAQQQVTRRRDSSNQYGYTDAEMRQRYFMLGCLITIFVVVAAVLGIGAPQEEEIGRDTWTNWNEDNFNNDNFNNDNFNNDNVGTVNIWNDDNNDNVGPVYISNDDAFDGASTPSFSWNDDINVVPGSSSWNDDTIEVSIATPPSWNDDNA